MISFVFIGNDFEKFQKSTLKKMEFFEFKDYYINNHSCFNKKRQILLIE